MDRYIVSELIDIVIDLNKSISMHIDNHNTKCVDKMCQDVAVRISSRLVLLTKKIKEMA